MARWLLPLMLAVMVAPPAHADSTTVGGTVTFEREPDDFNASKSTDWQINAAHTFDNHIIVGGSVKYYDTSHSSDHNVNVEGDIGYTHAFNDVFSLTGMAGIGQHFISSDDSTSFTYYVFTLAADIALTKTITWNAISVRYRNAFDTDNDYETPEIATGVTFRLNDHHSISARIERDWKDEKPSYTGIELGYKYHF